MPLPTNDGNGNQQRPNTGLPLPPSQDRPGEQKPAAPVGYPAPRGGLPAPTSPISRPMAPPPPPPVEDDAFEQLPMDQVADEDDFYTEPEPQRMPEPEPVQTPQRPSEDFTDFLEPEPQPAKPPTRQEETLEEEKSEFINTKTKKLMPFGGSKSKQDHRAKEDSVSRFDSREDRRNKARIVQIGALVALFGVVGLGGYNAINPPAGVSASEMNSAIAGAIETQNFPSDRAGSFAEDFIATYLTSDSANPTSKDLLSYYYTGVLGGSSDLTTVNYANASQRLVTQPKMYRFVPVTENSAAFEVAALVEASSTTTAADPNAEVPVQSKYKWVYYNVNVYYDVKTDTMAVTSDSPTLIPNANFGSAIDIPAEKLLGTGETNDELNEDVRSSLYGYLEAFARSSPTSHDTLDQYLLEGASSGPELVKGLGDKFELNGEPDSAVDYTAYTTEDPSVTKIDATVQWKDKTVVGEGSLITYTSRYYIEMQKQGNGQWLVSAFAPKYFLEAPEAE